VATFKEGGMIEWVEERKYVVFVRHDETQVFLTVEFDFEGFSKASPKEKRPGGVRVWEVLGAVYLWFTTIGLQRGIKRVNMVGAGSQCRVIR
jgi:hypothetical protein